jgi:hypothetical protein
MVKKLTTLLSLLSKEILIFKLLLLKFSLLTVMHKKIVSLVFLLKNGYINLLGNLNIVDRVPENRSYFTKSNLNLYFVFRYDLSDACAAALANGLLKDFNIISETDRDEVIDTFKVQREKQRMCAEKIAERSPDLQNLTCIGLDSKKDSRALLINTVGEGDDMRVFKSSGTVDNLTFTVESGQF